MGDMQNLSRRAFVVGSAAVAGGIAFGSYGDAAQAAPTATAIRWRPASGPTPSPSIPGSRSARKRSRSSHSMPTSVRASARCSRS